MELKYLQEKKIGKKQFMVEAPKSGDVTSDDYADVLANAVSVAIEEESVASPARISSVSVSVGGPQIATANITRSGNTGRMHGSSMDRMILARRLGIRR
jgi:hypothetical protein